MLQGPDACITDHRVPAAFYNSAVLLRPPTTASAWQSVLSRIETAVDSAGAGEIWLWSAFPTPDLTHRGWQLVGHPPLLVRTPGGTLPPAAPGVQVTEVVDTDDLETVNRVAAEAYPFGDLLPYRGGGPWAAGLLADPRWRFWLASIDERPVGAGVLFTSHGFAQLALGATRPEARHEGAWYAVVRERLLASGALLSGALFSDDSRPGIERLGYLPLLRFTLWSRARPVRSKTP